MKQNRVVADAVAGLAAELIPVLVNDKNLPGITTEAAAKEVIAYAVTQDKWTSSWRVVAVLLSAVTAALTVPEVQVIAGPWAPFVTALLAGASAAVSKIIDPRPTSMQ